MRNSRIRLFVLFFVLSFEVFASSYEWKATTNKTSVYVNEAIYLHYSCEFSGRGELYVIDFNPIVSNENYTIKPFSQTSKILDGKRVNSYEYIAYIHKAGVVALEFDVVMKKTNQDSIENTVIGRDNGEYEEFTKTFLKQKALTFDVKQTTSALVGSLDMKIKTKVDEVKVYEPFNLEVIIKGNANFEQLSSLKFELENVKVFTQKPVQQLELSKEDSSGVWSQRFAFVSDEDFVIPEFEIEYFDLKSKSKKSLFSKEIMVKVDKAYKKEELLDKEEEGFSIDYSFIYYILTFIVGFLVAKIKFKKEQKLSSKEQKLQEKIDSVKSLDELVFILILQNQKKYEQLIKKIENKEITSLKEAKKLIFY